MRGDGAAFLMPISTHSTTFYSEQIRRSKIQIENSTRKNDWKIDVTRNVWFISRIWEKTVINLIAFRIVCCSQLEYSIDMEMRIMNHLYKR